MLKCKTYFLIELNKSIKTKHKYFKNMSELIEKHYKNGKIEIVFRCAGSKNSGPLTFDLY